MWRDVLIHLSKSGAMRRLLLKSSVGRRIALRFVAGESLSDAITAVRGIGRRGASAQVDYLGENVETPDQACTATSCYLELLDRIAREGLDTHVSLKLTQIGLDLDLESCRTNVARIAERAAEIGSFVWIDMESSCYTDQTLQLYQRLRSEHSNVGVAIQAALLRTPQDAEHLLRMGATVRLCKGAYREARNVAHQDKRSVDRSFAMLSNLLLSSRSFQAIATHDERMIRHVTRLGAALRISRQLYEFQMLYGVRRDLQTQLARAGYRVRVYVPFGSQWYPYLMRRLAERPANLLFLLASVAREAQRGIVGR